MVPWQVTVLRMAQRGCLHPTTPWRPLSQPRALHIHPAFPKAGGTQEMQPQGLALWNDGVPKEEEPQLTART